MASYNKVILMGNLTRDPEMRYTPNGTPVASFAIAVNRKYKQGDETKEEVSYIDIVVFGKQAENCSKYLGKGDSVLIDGRLQQRRWETEDGQKRSKHEVVAQAVQFMPKRGAGSAPEPSEGQGDAPAEQAGSEPERFGAGEGPVADDIPF